MAKILITDLFGTLIPDSVVQAHNLYKKGNIKTEINEICNNKDYHKYLMDKLVSQCVNDIDRFIKEGNSVIIVSDLSAHEISIDFIIDEIINRFPKYEDNELQLYLTTKGSQGSFNIDRLNKLISSNYYENGIHYITYKGQKIGLLQDKKIEVYNAIQNQFDLSNTKLYAAGNNVNDVDMIIKCIQLGGRGSILNYELYTNEFINKTTLEEAIQSRILREFHLIQERKILDNFPDISSLDYISMSNIEQLYLCDDSYFNDLKEFEKLRLPELYKEVRYGNITLDQLIKEDLIYNQVDFARRHYLKKKTLTENRWDEIDMYSTFRDYFNKVLINDELTNKKLKKQ